MTISIPFEWLNNENTVYPITIDPTNYKQQSGMDVPIHSKRTDGGTSGDNNAVGASSQYGASRTLVYMGWPSFVYDKGTIINSAYYYARELTGRTSGFGIEVYRLTSHWNNYQTWTSRPDWDPKKLDWVNVNGSSNGGSTYWYKFNITDVVKAHSNGADNRGFMLKYDDEDGNANLRTFAQLEYATSSMRPYVILNYTEDTTAPTISSVSGNPTDWINGNVTLTVNGAKDNSGGSGLHSTPYSFSTTKDSYSWQSGNIKTFSSNCTVYVYVRDVNNNIRLVSTQDIKYIDNTNPDKPSVKKSENDWTNTSVTLTAKSDDSQSGVAEYSFSTVEGVYSWQTSNIKTFTENTTVYVYAKDAVGRISPVEETVIDNIDNIAPSKPVVTGNTDKWTNGDVVLSAESEDDLSGVNSYSFSKEPGKYKWQNDNTKTVSEKSKYYIYAKDNAGNISEAAEADLKIDKLAPTGSVNTESPSDWVKQVIITADAADEISGLHEKPYSFSTQKGVYSWQTEASKTVMQNGTYYIYARDSAENITLLDTVVIDKVDHSAPSVNNIELTDKGSKTLVTVFAEDTQSGIAEYSFDGGETWQKSNVFEFEKNSKNYLIIKVKDNLNNIESKYYDIYKPQLYYDNGRVGIYNPNPDCECDIYYKLNNSSSWQKYVQAFVVSENQKVISISFYNYSDYIPDLIPIKIEYPDIYEYSEKSTDLSLAYNGVSFNIDRLYKDDAWNYSVNSRLISLDDNLIKVNLPDFNSFMFVKQSKYLYLNEFYGYKLTVIYDDNDENAIEYIVSYNKLNYHYNTDGVLIKISSSNSDLFSFTYADNTIIIEDAAERKTVINYTDNHILSITDADGGVINYFYDNNNLVKVTDQANVIIGEYKYSGGKLVKSGKNNIKRDSENRVSEILADNGFSTLYTYGLDTVTASSSDEKSIEYLYDIYGNLWQTLDANAEGVTYSYDEWNRLIYSDDGENFCSLEYDNKNRIISKENNTGFLYYYYDENGNLIKIFDDYFSSEEESIITHYVYDEYSNVIIKASINNKTGDYTDTFYTSELNYDSVISYEYENGLPVKAEDNNGSSTVYTYDEYGNTVKTVTTVTEKDKTTVSISESTYDITGRLISSKSDNSNISYTYDAAGRTLLTNADGNYQRTVYDNYGRIVQKISASDYNPEIDNLSGAYPDKSVGYRYEYDSAGNLVKEINDSDIETVYTYSEVGTLYKKSFDIYDYYYQNNGVCDKIDVNGKTVLSYEYNITEAEGFELEQGESLNKISYANGYTEYHKIKNDIIMAKYSGSGDSQFYYIKGTQDGYNIYENELSRSFMYSENENVKSLKRYLNYIYPEFLYSVKEEENKTTVNETHFEKDFTTVIQENSIDYNAPSSSFSYVAESTENSAKASIVKDSASVLSSEIIYNEDENIITKSYNDNSFLFTAEYDDSGNIVSDGQNSYEYDGLGQLVKTTGAVNSSYTYDGRGNILTKTVNGETTAFEYNNEWKDQLTAVNGTPLAYDENGNLISYGEDIYTWSHGRQLASITTGGRTYQYTYDSNGMRASKIYESGGKVTYDVLGGKILAEYSGGSGTYFQYSGYRFKPDRDK